MQKGWSEMRRSILLRFFDRLEECYGRELCREARQKSSLSLHEIDALLAFRSDPPLEDLRDALARIDYGTFGICLSCREPIEYRLLEREPTQRMCGRCERRFFHVTEPHHAVVQYFAP
jgi:hypothetical protein